MPGFASYQVWVVGIVLQGDSTLLGRFPTSICPQKEVREAVVHAGIAWIEFYGVAEVRLGFAPLVLRMQFTHGTICVGGCQRGVEFDRLRSQIQYAPENLRW